MAKKKSSLMAYFINIGTVASPNWASLGKGVTQLGIDYNPEVTSETYINEDAATSSVDSYAPSSGIDVALWDSTSAPAHAYLENLRKTRATGANAETEILEIDISTASPYTAQKNSAVVSVGSFKLEGGKPQQLSVTINYNGSPVDGTATITSGAPAFTASGVTALAMSSIVPAAAATGISRSASIVITFNNAIKAENVSLATAAGATVAFTKSWDAARKILTLTPSSTMSATTLHIVTLAGVTDTYGQILATATSVFTTGS